MLTAIVVLFCLSGYTAGRYHVKFEGDMGDIADYEKQNEVNQTDNLFCSLTCGSIDTCVTQAQKTCDKECFPVQPPSVSNCSSSFHELGYWEQARSAFKTCTQYYDVALHCNNETVAAKTKRSLARLKRQPGPPPNPSPSCHEQCFRREEYPCFKGCPRPTEEQQRYLKQCSKESFDPLFQDFEVCIHKYDAYMASIWHEGHQPGIIERPPPPPGYLPPPLPQPPFRRPPPPGPFGPPPPPGPFGPPPPGPLGPFPPPRGF